MITMVHGADSSMINWRAPSPDFGSQSSPYVRPASEVAEQTTANLNRMHHENGLFSSSLSDLFNKKLSLPSGNVCFGQSMGTSNFKFEHGEPFDSSEEIEAQTIGSLLPDTVDDLLSGITDEECMPRLNNREEVEIDLFCSGGGLELEGDDNLIYDKASRFFGVGNGQPEGLSAQFAGEHPYSEHPSRTLLVSNIKSNIQDSELRNLFEKFGDIHTLYTACKHRGYITISYFDVRAAQNAMVALQNKLLRHWKLDIRFSTAKDNPSEKDGNQATVMVFNLDSSISNDELHRIFGAYGEVKEIRVTPNKHHPKFVEFYDVRSAEAALQGLNKSDIGGKRIILVRCCSGNARRLSPQLSTELDEEKFRGCRIGSPLSNLPPECVGSITLGAKTSNALDNLAIQSLHPSVQETVSPLFATAFHGLSSSVPHGLSSPVRSATVGNHSNQTAQGYLNNSQGHNNFGYPCTPDFLPHSLPDYHGWDINCIRLNSSCSISAMDIINSQPADGIDNSAHRVGFGSLNNHSSELTGGEFRNGSCHLHGHQYHWNNSDPYQNHFPGAIWQNSPPFVSSICSHPLPQMDGFPRAPSHMLNTILPLHHHHVGSAPSMNPLLWDVRQTYKGDSVKVNMSAFVPGPLGNMGLPGSSPQHPLELTSHNIFPHAGGNCIDPSISSVHIGVPSPHQRCHMFHGRNMVHGSYDGPNDRARSRRSDASVSSVDNKKQFELDIDRIMSGEDSRMTLMIKNIPNKYTSKMLLATIDEHHRGTYDFFYLPIDFKNKCNVGYAFINMVDPRHIILFYQTFNGKKWEKFNSEKVASLAYARIQGRPALIANFQNSSLMNEDKRCRPILFHTDGPQAGDQKPFPVGVNIRCRPSRSRTAGNEELHQGRISPPVSGEESSSATESSSFYTKGG